MADTKQQPLHMEYTGEEHTPVLTIVTIMISVFLLGMGTALQSTALSMRAGIEGFSSFSTGIILAAFYVGIASGSVIAPNFVRSVGYVRTFAAFASIASVTAIAHVIWINPYLWFVFRGLHGICVSIMLVVVESWLNAASSTYNRGRILSFYSVSYIFSMGVGQPLIGLFSPAEFKLFGITTIFISMCLVPITLANVKGVPSVEKRSAKIFATFKRCPLGGSGIFVNGIMFGATWSLLPRYGQILGMAENNVGIIMLLISVGTLILQWPLGWLSDRRDRRIAIGWASAIGAAAALLIIPLSSSSPLLYFLIFLFGGTAMPLYSLSIALVNDQLSKHEMVQAAGAIVIFYGIGSALGPVFGGMCISRIGPQGLFIFQGLILAIYTAVTVARVSIVPRKIKGTKSKYMPYPRTTQTAFRLLRKFRPKKRIRDKARNKKRP